MAATTWLGLSFALAGLLLPAAHAQPSQSYTAVIESRSAGPQARIEVLGEPFAALPAVSSSQSRIVLYRPVDERPGAASIFVNNRYHASLVPGAWSQLCLASGPATLATRHTLAANNPAKDRFDAVSTLTLTGGQVQYLRVNMRTEQSELGPVPAEQALQEMASTREQLHTVSRVTQTCAEIATAKSPRPTAAR